MGLLTKAIFTNFRSFVDKGIKLELVTLEHDPEMLKDISKLHQKNVNVYITEGLIDPAAIEILDTEAVEGMPIKTKTPSQRLRQVIWLLWEQEGAQGKDEDYYNVKMEEIIQHYKTKLQ